MMQCQAFDSRLKGFPQNSGAACFLLENIPRAQADFSQGQTRPKPHFQIKTAIREEVMTGLRCFAKLSATFNHP